MRTFSDQKLAICLNLLIASKEQILLWHFFCHTTHSEHSQLHHRLLRIVIACLDKIIDRRPTPPRTKWQCEGGLEWLSKLILKLWSLKTSTLRETPFKKFGQHTENARSLVDDADREAMFPSPFAFDVNDCKGRRNKGNRRRQSTRRTPDKGIREEFLQNEL